MSEPSRRARQATTMARLLADQLAALVKGRPARCLARRALLGVAEIGFVGFDDFAFAAHGHQAAVAHGFTNAVHMNQADL